jgi:Ca2+-transporting ATPase
MRFVGLLALEDPPREGVRDAIEHAAHAGIRTIMLTGDSPETAESIAHDVGIVGDVMHGRKIDTLDDDELFAALGTTSVFARVSPAHKLRILESLRSHGAVVAMTGDGVNDAPALKRADVGIAMGRVGTHVAREAASIVLADDHFATIVKAIAEGRRIYDNIRKFVVYLLRANAGQLLFITSTMLLGLPLPLLPIHILWINLMTDGLPALALGMEPAERDVMQRPPRGAREDIFSGELSRFIIFVCVAAFLPLALFGWDIESGIAIDLARARVFSLSILLELLLAFATRSDRSLFRVGFFGNYWLMLAVLPPIVLHILILSFAPLRAIFHLAPMGSGDVVTVLACGIGSLLALESLKFVYQPSRNHRVLR